MSPDTLAAFMENIRQLYAMIKKLQSFEGFKNGSNFVCEKVPFCKFDHIYESVLHYRINTQTFSLHLMQSYIVN